MAWVSVIDLHVYPGAQRCTFLRRDDGNSVVRYESISVGFTADIVFDSEGLVATTAGNREPPLRQRRPLPAWTMSGGIARDKYSLSPAGLLSIRGTNSEIKVSRPEILEGERQCQLRLGT
jgi:hypothetical protein